MQPVHRRLAVVSLLLLGATGSWTVAMAIDLPDVSEVGLVMIGISLWVATTGSVAGMMVSRSRWARRLAVVVAAGHGALAVSRPVDIWWVAGIALTVASGVAAAGPWLDGIVRSLPAASGPPTRAVLVPLLLIGVPYFLGLVGSDGVAAAVGLGALVAAFWFVRVLPGALWAVRVVWPLVALALAWPIGGWGSVVSAVAGVTVATIAWHPSVARSVSPLVERGSVVRIPPELTPGEVLDAAGLDEHGRPK